MFAVYPDALTESVRFCFYNTENVRNLSVCTIRNEISFDRFSGRGVDGGLHDTSLGVTSLNDVCGHCGLDFFTCPGHFGRVEFDKPVYNPLFFDVFYKLLKSFCFSCFRLYGADQLSAALHFLGAPSFTLPGKPKYADLVDLKGLPHEELRKIGLRALALRPRIPCKLCAGRSWIIKHNNRQQIVIRPSSASSHNPRNEALQIDEEGDINEILLSAGLKDPRIGTTSSLYTGSNIFKDLSNSKNADVLADLAKDAMLSAVRKSLINAAGSALKLKETGLSPEIARLMLRCLWANDAGLLCLLLPMLRSMFNRCQYPTDVFFMDDVLVSPSICRWPRVVGGLAYEHPETAVYSRIVKKAQCLSHIVTYMKQQEQPQLSEGGGSPDTAAKAEVAGPLNISGANAQRAEGALQLASLMLQAAVNGLYDSAAAVLPAGLEAKTGVAGGASPNVRLPGLRQKLEKKEGLFRMHMMGKRVNYACRSVISPDPNLDITEVGVPLFFASRLTFPEPVTAFNLTQLRQLVTNGPKNYPGARSLQTPSGQVIHFPTDNGAQSVRRRQMLARRLAPPSARMVQSRPYIVHRHLLEGDVLVMNRQPTLHRPSMQAHKVRIIHSSAAKTLRMHYSNCRAYNADFDGDEMNGHLVQNYCAKAELQQLAAVPHHYLLPKDGFPVAGLIQDHVIAAVKLTMRDRLLTYDDYTDLVYHAHRSLFWNARQSNSGPPDLIMLKPAIMWPKRLWTGKQVISTLLMNLTPANLPYLNVTLRARRTKVELWSGGASATTGSGHQSSLSNVDVVVCDGYLASGLLDKSHIGSTSGGLVHCVHEVYGPAAATHLLNGIGLLANRLLKFTGFTMAIQDMLLSAGANAERTRRFEGLRDLGLCAFADAFELSPDSLSEAEVHRLYRQAHFAPSTDQVLGKRLMQLDLAMKNRLKRAQDAVCDLAIPGGLHVGFPENNLHLMVHVGAKGGMVNAQQMSVALGQIELEGRRVPLMLSGRSLPSFPPYDVRPRAGGMCTHRFLTALPPQELFFHSMAGRDGLIDTAIKTSRAGYLQRSAIKHLEDLSIHYDGTVRDAGQNVVQFRYGDDGVDVCQAAFLQPTGLQMFAENADLLAQRWRCSHLLAEAQADDVRKQYPLPRQLQTMADDVALRRQTVLYESLSDRKLSKFLRKARRVKEQVEELKRSSSSSPEEEEEETPAPCELAASLRDLCTAKLIAAQSPSGEPVGLLAAQSVGEPSTQMTLNTFHFAGRGEMNVTLGIPRLREILMTGSANISTPCMEVPVFSTPEARRSCIQISRRLHKLKLIDTLELPIGVKVDYFSDSYTLEFRLLPRSAYSERSCVKPARVLRFLERVIFPDLAKKLDNELKDQGKISLIRSYTLSTLARQQQTTGRSVADEDTTAETGELHQAGRLRKARDEWNQDEDGQEAIRRRRMEAEAEEEDENGGGVAGAGFGSQQTHRPRQPVIDLDDAVDLDACGVSDDGDDDEAAELKEIGRQDKEEDEDGEEYEEEEEEEGGPRTTGLADGSRATPMGAKYRDGFAKSGDTGLIDEDTQDGLVFAPTDLEQQESKSMPDHENRMLFVTRLHARFTAYAFDRSEKPKWARLTICMFDPKEGRISIDLKTLAMRIINKGIVSSVPGIDKVIIDRSNMNSWIFRVEGINTSELMRYPAVFDLSRLYTNNIAEMCRVYGIEAARATIQKEVSSVFGHYGIHVNSRHLSLISDYMTKSGFYRAFNRMAFVSHPSPFQQMSFETVTSALRSTIQEDRIDSLMSPSGSVVVGRLVHNAGTNCFDLYQKIAP